MSEPTARTPRARSHLRAVVFDLGGVVLGSPLHAIARYERANGLPANAVNRVVAQTAPHGAWSRLERGELARDAFFAEFERECRAAGHAVDARAMFAEMEREAQPRPAMLDAIARLRAHGLAVAALTNDWSTDGARGAAAAGAPEPVASAPAHALAAHFDVFVASSVVGLRKPDPRIYALACERLGVAPPAVAFLDDIGANLKPARAMGMTTIRVVEPLAALAELEAAVGFPLR